MPEGDTIHRLAARLQVIRGKVVIEASSRVAEVRPALLRGRRVEAIAAQGKNLLIEFDNGRVLHVHLGMYGSVRLFEKTAAFRGPHPFAKVVLDFGDQVAVCLKTPTARLTVAEQFGSDARLDGLGPDLLAPDFAERDALARLRAHPDMPLGVAVMDQHLVAGIGNVYKSETLFLCRANPFLLVTQFSDLVLLGVLRRARALMLENVRPEAGRRRTRGPAIGRYWVYRRAGGPCFSCGTEVKMLRQGEQQRSTYFCPACQRVAA
jgi:endonuclease-8